MDYYYSLLNSYELLKRRKFKLSLREEEGEGDEGSKEKVADLQAAAGAGTREAPGTLNGIDVWMEDGKILATDPNDPAPQPQTASVVGADGERVKGPSANLLWGKIFPGGEEDGSTPEAPEEEGGGAATEGEGEDLPDENDLKLESLAQDISLKLETLAELDENFKPENMEKITELLHAPVPDIPGAAEQKVKAVAALDSFLSLSTELATNPKLARDGKFVHKINTFIDENNIELTQHGVLFQGSYFETDFMVEGDFPINTAIAAMNDLQKKNKEELGKGSVAEEVPKISKKEQGRRNQYRGCAAEFLAEAAAPLAAFLESDDPAVRQKALIELQETVVKAQQEVQAEDEKGKKVWEMEDGRRKKATDKNGVPLKDAKGKPIYIPVMVEALDIPALVSVFTVGVGVREGTLLVGDVGPGSIDDAAAIDFLRERLIAAGVDEDLLDLRLQEIASGDTPIGGLQAVLLVLAANRDFERQYMGDLKPSSTRAVGGGAEIEGQTEEMTDQGAKADMIDTFCENPDTGQPYTKEELVTHFDSLLSDDQRKHYATGCGEGSEPFAGAEALVREVEKEGGGTCLDVDRELKVFNDHDDAKHKLGQQSGDTVDSVCAHDRSERGEEVDPKYNADAVPPPPGAGSKAMTDVTKQFVDKTKERLEACGFDKVFQGMCDFDTALDLETKKYDTMFDRTLDGWDEEDAEDAIRLWYDNAGGPKMEKGRRYAAGIAAIRNGPYPKWIRDLHTSRENLDKDGNPKKTEQQLCEGELTTIGGYLKTGTLLRSLREDTNSSELPGGKGRVLIGPGLQFMIGRYAVTCGSDRECVKQKRHLQENTQSISFNNAEIQANIAALKNGTGRIRQGTGIGGQFYLEVKNPTSGEWEIRAQGSAERGGITWFSNKESDVSHQISGEETPKEKGKKKKRKKGEPKEDMFVQFLHGQQTLLEKLLNQST